MMLITALLFALPCTLISAAPVVKSPIAARQALTAEAAIGAWLTDIIQVNDFLNNFGGTTTTGIVATGTDTVSDFTAAADTLLGITQDEENQLDALSGLVTTDAGTNAVAVLATQFALYLRLVTNMIENVSPTDNVEEMKTMSCTTILPNANKVWIDAATSNGLQAPSPAPGPNFCPVLDPTGSFYEEELP